MYTNVFIHKVFKGELGQLDAYNKSFDFTIGEKLKIEILITEIDQFCKSKTFNFRQAIEWRIDVALNLPSDFNYHLFLDDGFNDFELREIDDKVKNYVDEHLIKEFLDYCNLDLVKDLFPDLGKSLNQLKTDLLSFLDSQSEVPTSEKKQSKGVWGLAARYNFIKELGVLEMIDGMSDQTLRSTFISQILGCSLDSAKKLKNNSYPSDETIEEQLQRKQLIELIKQH